HFYFNFAVRSFLDSFFSLRDVDIFVRKGTHCRATVDKTSSRLPLDHIRSSFATRLSLHKRFGARVLQDGCGLGGSAEFPRYCDSLLLDYFCGFTSGRAELELPSNNGNGVRGGYIGWALCGFQCKLYTSHAGEGPPRVPASHRAL